MPAELETILAICPLTILAKGRKHGIAVPQWAASLYPDTMYRHARHLMYS